MCICIDVDEAKITCHMKLGKNLLTLIQIIENGELINEGKTKNVGTIVILTS
jgi:hypothetical protein